MLAVARGQGGDVMRPCVLVAGANPAAQRGLGLEFIRAAAFDEYAASNLQEIADGNGEIGWGLGDASLPSLALEPERQRFGQSCIAVAGEGAAGRAMTAAIGACSIRGVAALLGSALLGRHLRAHAETMPRTSA